MSGAEEGWPRCPYCGGSIKDRIRSHFEDNPWASLHVKEVAEVVGREPNSVRSTLHRLKVDGVLYQPSPGHYKLKPLVERLDPAE